VQQQEQDSGGGADSLVREVTYEMDSRERKDILAANKQAVEDNLPAFVAKLKEVGPPNEWSGAAASSIGPEMRKALTRAWGYLDQPQRNEVKAAFKEGMGKEAPAAELEVAKPMSKSKPGFEDYDAEVQKMLAESQ